MGGGGGGVERKIRSQSGQVVDFGGGRGRVLVRADTTGGQRRWIQWGSMTGPHWSEIQVVGGRGGGRFILLSVNNQTAEKSSAVKCG